MNARPDAPLAPEGATPPVLLDEALLEAGTPAEPEPEGDAPVHEDGEGAEASASPINPAFVGAVEDALGAEDTDEVRRLANGLHPADAADLIERLGREDRGALVEALGADFDADTLVELDESTRDDLVEAMPNAQLSIAVAELETDEAAFVLEDMDEADRAEVLAGMPVADRLALEQAFDYPEDSAGRMMQRDVLAAPNFQTVGEVLDRMRSASDLPDEFFEVYVVDPTYRVTGVVPLSRFVRATRDARVQDLAIADHPLVKDVMDREEVAVLFEKYNLISAPVVDEGQRLVGMITVDDVVEVVREEGQEDLLALAGVERDEGGINQSVRRVARSRFTWLSVNLGTAILASFVIGLFDATLAEAVALAILMPIVASMGGNAGTQTLAVAVRNLATRDLTASNALRTVTRETLVSLINGAAFAFLLGVAAAFWYGFAGYGEEGDGLILGLVLAAAMIITMLCAGLAGVLVPLALQRAGADPAVSSAVFVTTVTDVVGFFAFLGLAAVFLVG